MHNRNSRQQAATRDSKRTAEGSRTPGQAADSVGQQSSAPKTVLLVMTILVLVTAAVVAVGPALAISGPGNTASELQSAAQTLADSADTTVSQATPNTNYGTSTSLHVSGKRGSAKNAYLRFSTGTLTSSIQSAQLRLYSTAPSRNAPAVYQAANTWTESGSGGVTWETKPALLGALIVNKGVISKDAWVTYNVTAVVGTSGTYTFALIGDSRDGSAFSSREGAHPPQLVLTLSTAAPITPTATSAAAATPVASATATRQATATSVASPTSTRQATATSAASPTATRVATATAVVSPTQTVVPAPSGSIQHVFVVVMENHGYTQVWNTSSSPYITQLGNSFSRSTNYHATSHPSLPNYLELYAGSNYGITTDCNPSSSCHSSARNLADNLDAKGLTWKGYMESMPAPCTLTTSGNYAPKHNPFVYFDDIRTNTTRCNSHDVPFTALSADLASAATTPNYAMIVPNLCNDMHDCSVSTGDTWLSNHLPAILNSPACTAQTCLVALTWDEDDGSQGNHVLTIFAGSGAKTGGVTSAVSYSHYSLLRTVENIFGLPTQTSNDAAASSMNDLLR